ncbi:ATP-binding cassette domain-containing protein [Salinisphaera sp. P385]|uniref:ATP-binding cassette domain-containing protein n=1 Tax=Spectribacter acetivorans TaxID=3075603 RepID=A0ABU3B794_9GAMM|nr:ATP-binding cassette domain-containing protein [Salinisphaera sp. P385]MDT0618327.1 ATP-binding cassette domain-containing protein [Salinisphaera sp. P385]
MNNTPMVEARGVSRTVPGPDGPLMLLDAIDLTVARGETVAVGGPSGSGKSTLLGLLAGLDVPSAGDIRLAGEAFSDLDEDARAARRGALCGFVFQSFHLVSDLTARENVMLPLELAGADRPGDAADRWLERVGLTHRRQHFPPTLSGGEQQRVGLARAFATRPQLLFADEPTGSLDHANRDRVAELLFDLNREAGTALLLVTHDDDLAHRCQRVLRLEAGRLQHG